MLWGSRISWFVMKEQPPGCSLTAGPTGHLFFTAEEKENRHTHCSHVMFTASNVDFELGRCKEGDCTKHGKLWRGGGGGSLAEGHPGNNLPSLKPVIADALYCHGKGWRRTVRRKEAGCDVVYILCDTGKWVDKLKQILGNT